MVPGGMIGVIAIYLFMTIQQMGANKCKLAPVFPGCPEILIPENNIDYLGNDLWTISTPDWQTCAKKCSEESRCSHWTWITRDYVNARHHLKCFFKTSDAGRRPFQGVTSGIANECVRTLYMKKSKNSYRNCIQNPECGGCADIVKKRLPLLLQENMIKEGEIGVNNGSLVNQQKTRGQTLTLRKVGDIKTIRTDNEMVTINGTVNRMVGKRSYAARTERPTGLYAGPGDLVTITFPEELVGRVTIDIGNFFDFPKLSFSVRTTICKIGSPYGGLINLRMKSWDSYKGAFTVKITNAIKAPTFIYNVTTNEEWKEIRKYSPKMSVLRVPGQVQIFVQTLKIKDITDMEATMSRIKLTMDALEDMLGLPKGSRPGEEVLYFEPGMGGGYHGGICTSGFNVVGDDLYTEDKISNYSTYYDDFFKESGTNGLILHEFGHGYCSKDLPSEGDHWYVETVSSYIRLIRRGDDYQHMTSKDLDFPLLFRMVGFSRYSRGKPCGLGTGEFLYKHKHWNWYFICWKWIHWIPSRIHGWNVFKDVHALAEKTTKNYNSKNDRLVDLYCQVTKHNMIPLFNVWNIKPSEQAITDNCQKLPESEILTQWLNIVKCVNQSMDHVDKDIRDCAKMPKFPQHKGLCLLNGVCRNAHGMEIILKDGKETFDLFGSSGIGAMSGKKKPTTENKENCFERAEYVFLDCKNTMNYPITATFYEKKQDTEINYKKTGSYTYQGYCLVHVGNSGSPTRTVPVNDGCDCPAVVNRTNWHGTWHQDEFSVTRVGSSLEIKRTDQNSGWGQDFSFSCKGKKPNVIAYMSSLYSNDYRAKKCMDGDINTFCHTQNETNPYFVIEYTQPITVTDVKVTVRKSYWERAKQMVVIVANTRPLQGQLASGSQLGETFIGPATYSAQVITFKSKTGITGKYVIVQQQYKGIINFAEVQVNNECENLCSSKEGCPLAKNRLVAILPELKMEFNVSFEFRATAWQSGWQNVIHFTEGGNCCNAGARVPGFWVNPSGRLHPCFAVGDNGNYCTLTTKEYSLNTWHKVEISQTLKTGKYMYRVVVDREDIFAPVENTKPRTFSNVQVYAADNFYNPLKGSIRNLILNPRCGDEDN